MTDSKVRAKFYVQSVELTRNNPDAPDPLDRKSGTVKLSAVTRGDINKDWARYTPSGTVTMSIGNPAALDMFLERIGKEFYVDFTEAPPDDQS